MGNLNLNRLKGLGLSSGSRSCPVEDLKWTKYEINKIAEQLFIDFNDLESQLAEAREFIKIVGRYGDCSNPLMAINRIMKHYDKLKEQGDE